MSCNYCRLPERNKPSFDVLQKMIELNHLGVCLEISNDYSINTFKIRMYSETVEIVRHIPFYNIPFVELVIDEMFKDLKKGAQI